MIAWHYTTGQKLYPIIRSGYLDPNKTVTPKNEKPLLWFSTNQHWENTASKAALNVWGEIIVLDMESTLKLCNGLYRFGVPVERVLPWQVVARKARMKTGVMKQLIMEGLSQNARHQEWNATLDKIRDSDCILQAYVDGEWRTMRESLDV